MEIVDSHKSPDRAMRNKISVIIPIYRVEDFLPQCLDSVINQTHQNLEIILVDDGSPDSCPQICDDYARKDGRIKVIHQQNGGLSAARNTGLKIATGDFIAFVDSDDFIDCNMYQLLFDKVMVTKSQIVECGVSIIYENEIGLRVYETSQTTYGTEAALQQLIKGDVFKTHVWNKLYTKEVIANIKFPNGKINEDEFWTYLVFANARKISYLPVPLYNYLQRRDSIMGSYSTRKVDGVEGMLNRMGYMKKNYPNLYIDSKLVVFRTCLYHYQMIMGQEGVDKSIALKKLTEFRKKISFSLIEMRTINRTEVIKIVMSGISLRYTCKLAKLFK